MIRPINVQIIEPFAIYQSVTNASWVVGSSSSEISTTRQRLTFNSAMKDFLLKTTRILDEALLSVQRKHPNLFNS